MCLPPQVSKGSLVIQLLSCGFSLKQETLQAPHLDPTSATAGLSRTTARTSGRLFPLLAMKPFFIYSWQVLWPVQIYQSVKHFSTSFSNDFGDMTIIFSFSSLPTLFTASLCFIQIFYCHFFWGLLKAVLFGLAQFPSFTPHPQSSLICTKICPSENYLL